MEDPELASAKVSSEDTISAYWHDLVAVGLVAKESLSSISRQQQEELTEMAQDLSRRASPATGIPNIAAVTLNPAWVANHSKKPKYLVAFNTKHETALRKYIEENDLDKTDFQIVEGNPQVGGPREYKYHAEMRILDHLDSLGQLNDSIQDQPQHFIGISMPCCDKCGACLAVSGVAFEGGHGQAYSKWTTPSAIYSNPKRLARFLGGMNATTVSEIIENEQNPSVIERQDIRKAQGYGWTGGKAIPKKKAITEWAPQEAEFLLERDGDEIDPEELIKLEKRNKLRLSQDERLADFQNAEKSQRTGFNVLSGRPVAKKYIQLGEKERKANKKGNYGQHISEDGLSDEEAEARKKRALTKKGESTNKKVKKSDLSDLG